MVFNYSFKVFSEGKNYKFDIVAKDKNLLSGYKIVPRDEADLPVIQKFFQDALEDAKAKTKANEPLTVNKLLNRLKVLPNISKVDVKASHLFAAHFLLPDRSIGMAKLMHMVKNITSDADIRMLCRECLSQNNNNLKLALNSLKNAFRQVGDGTVPVKIADMLTYEATERNVDEIKAFGRKRTVDVVQFIKALPKRADGTIDLTKMKKIGEGGTQDVFVLKNGKPSFVIKVNRESLKMKNNERLEKFNRDKASYQTLHNSFGDHCTVEQLLLRDVADDSGIKKAIISVADFELGFQKESKFGLQADDFYWDDIIIVKNLDAYEDMLKSVLFLEDPPSFDLKTLEALNPKVVKIVELISQEPFKNALKKFLTKFQEYFNKTGQYLDIQGKDNIIFFKEGEGWTFKLGTVIKRETVKRFENSLNWLHNGSKETEGAGIHMSILGYCFHWTKTLNTLAKMVGMDRVITDPKIVTMWDDLEKAGITEKPSDPQRFLEILQAVETYPAEKLLEVFKALSVDPEKEADCILSILAEAPLNKKMVLAQYLHQVLPRAPDDYKFCRIRFYTARYIEKIPEGKALALECYEEVLKDPDGPHEEVLEAIKQLQ